MFTRDRRGIFVLVSTVALLGALVLACGPKLPSTYSAEAHRAAIADEGLKYVRAFSETAIGLNTLPPGPGRLTDADTRIVRDLALTLTDALETYAKTGVPTAIQVAVDSFGQRLSANAKASPKLKTAWALVQTQLVLILPLLPDPFVAGKEATS